ncbi:alpha/beta hydrolase [Amycolatopsis antarctica]|uniref:Alpha/beta hydrolase n=1 Tax=Amycolatopsis antarctica TaxID=1854586 RepID=A0A263D1J9_9PSEU|nr:alpha/beta hydrolase [Amycolatopsis antarctica]OZM71978.1 alpha/beta hydrolase [Amycolatopsis antarctica]
MLNQGLWSAPGCDIRFWDHPGDSAPVVFLHGAGADHLMFDAQARHLARQGHRVVTWDLRGHGLSRPSAEPFTAEQALTDLAGLIDRLGLDRPVLAGQSLGGNLAQEAVRRWPRMARALVVIDSAWNAAPLSATDRLLLRLASPALSLIPAGSLPRVLANASAVTPGARADARRAFALLSKPEFLAAWRATATLLRPDPGYRTPVPLLLIRGERDRTGDIAARMPRWAATDGVAEHVIAGAGHIANQDAPDAVNEVLSAFLHGLPEAGDR